MNTRVRTRRVIARVAVVFGVAIAGIGVDLLGDTAAAEHEQLIVCLGDSLTEGFGVLPEQSYPALLEARLRQLGHDVRVVNAGISGSTSASGVSRLEWQLRAKPDIVILGLGGNDGLRGLALNRTRKNLSRTIALAQSKGVQVILAGMKIPPNYGLDYTREFEQIFRALAKEHQVPLIPFLLEGVAAKSELNIGDGIHPNPEGYVLVVDNVLPLVLSVLGQPGNFAFPPDRSRP
ncbi:MAG: arylesterase [Myxococcota bacterium]|jgi:acyl-CoA thioesterase-1